MGQEFAQFKEWDFQNGLDWLLLEYESHDKMRKFVRALNRIYAKRAPLWEIDYDWEGFKWLSHNDNSNSVVAFVRRDAAGDEVVTVCNFVPAAHEDYKIGVPAEGRYNVILNTDDEMWGGGGFGQKSYISKPVPMHGQAHSISLKLPAMSTLYLSAGQTGKKHPEK